MHIKGQDGIIFFWLFQILEQEKVHNLVTVKEFPLYMVPLDEDVISFELELSEKVCTTLICPICTYYFMYPFPEVLFSHIYCVLVFHGFMNDRIALSMVMLAHFGMLQKQYMSSRFESLLIFYVMIHIVLSHG